MKTSFTLLATAAALVAAQDLGALPACGQTCISNMLAIAPSFQCNVGDTACYCRQPDFGYGIRDCANEACGNSQEAESVISYGTQYCAAALSSTGSNDATATSAGSAAQTASGNSTDSATSSAITTSALVGVVTTDGSTITTTTGSTTIFGLGGAVGSATSSAGSAISSASSSIGSEISSAQSSLGSAISSASTSIEGAVSSISSSLGGEASSATQTTSTGTSDGAGAYITAAPMLVMGALAALAL